MPLPAVARAHSASALRSVPHRAAAVLLRWPPPLPELQLAVLGIVSVELGLVLLPLLGRDDGGVGPET